MTGRMPRVSRGRRAQPLDQAHGESARDRRLALDDTPHGARKGGEVDVLAQVAGGARAEREKSGVLVVAAGEHHDADLGGLLEDLAHGGDAVDAGQADVHEHHVGPVVQGQLDSLLAVGGVGGHRAAGLLQGVTQGAPGERVVVGDEHAQARLAVLAVPLATAMLSPSLRGHAPLHFEAGAVQVVGFASGAARPAASLPVAPASRSLKSWELVAYARASSSSMTPCTTRRTRSWWKVCMP